MASQTLLGRTFLSLLLIIALVSCEDCATFFDELFSGENRRLEIISDLSFVFTQAGETAQISARVVNENGFEVFGSEISFESSDPSLVSVDSDGLLTARSSNVGSALITISSEDLQALSVLAVVADLTPETVYITADEVISVDHEKGYVILERNPKTQEIKAGTVLLSGDLSGLLDRVVSVHVGDSRVEIETEPASLIDAFENAVVETVGVPLEYSGVIDAEGERVFDKNGSPVQPFWLNHSRGSRFGNEYQELSLRSLANMPCKLDDVSVVNINLQGGSIEHQLSIVPRVDLKIERRTVERFDLYLDQVAHVTAVVGAVELTGGLSGTIKCELKLTNIPLAFVPILGPLGIGPSVTPVVGVDFTASYQAGSIEIQGPRLDKGFRALAGLGYTNLDGFRIISEFNEQGDGVSFVGGDYGLEHEFSVGVSPYFGINVNTSALLGWFTLASFDFADAQVGGGAELSMTLPFSPEELGYRGPRWEFFVGASASLNPLMERLEPVERLMSRIGIPRAADIISLDLTIFEVKATLAESPNPSLTVSPGQVAIEDEVSIQVSARGEGAMKAEIIAFRDDEETSTLLFEENTDAAGNLTTTWTPEEEDAGEYKLSVLVYDSIFGAMGFPYAPEDSTNLSVTTETVLNIDPSGLAEGEVDVEYAFTLNALRIPPDVPEVTFEWNFGDGTTGSHVETPVDGSANVTISNTFTADGVYGLIAIVKDDTETLATASAVLTIGLPEEREEELDVCDQWKAAQSGGHGATVDVWDISNIPSGASFDISFDAYSIPDKYIIEYPDGSVVLDTGWRGDSSYNGNARYPGGISGPGQGEILDMFRKSARDSFKVTVIGGEPGTAWVYSIRCRE